LLLPYVEYFFRPVPGYARFAQPIVEALSLRAWRKARTPPAPRSIKVAAIRRQSVARPVFVETGTFYGDTLAAVRDDFERVVSIELQPRLARRARRRFRDDPGVTIVEGDSGSKLGPVLRRLDGPAVLWLDGHYSGMLTARGDAGDTPILRELDVALREGSSSDAILIDDARLFGTDPAYPEVADVQMHVGRVRPGWRVHVEDDIIHILPE